MTTPEERKAHVEALSNDPSSTDPQVRAVRELLGAAVRLDGDVPDPDSPLIPPEVRQQMREGWETAFWNHTHRSAAQGRTEAHSAVEWTDAELNALAMYRHAESHEDAREAEEDLRTLIAAREAQARAEGAVSALREFGPWVQQEHACDPEEECPEGTCRLCDLLFAVYSDANERAERIERGES